MSSGQRSIKQRMQRAKAPGLRLTVARDWAENWRADQSAVVADLSRARRATDWNGIDAGIAQLRAVTEKRFAALPGVLDALAENRTKDNDEQGL